MAADLLATRRVRNRYLSVPDLYLGFSDGSFEEEDGVLREGIGLRLRISRQQDDGLALAGPAAGNEGEHGPKGKQKDDDRVSDSE